MCRPGHGSSQDPSTGGHIGPPLRGPKGIREPTEIGVKGRVTGRDGARPLRGGGAGRCVQERRGVVTPPYGSATGGAQQWADVPKAWLPPAKFRSEIWGVSHRHRPLRPAGGRGTARRVVVPYGWLRRAAAIALGSGAQRSVCASGCKGWVGIAVETIPKRGQQRRTIPQSRPLAVPAPFTQGSLWGRGMRIAALALRASSQ